MKLLIDTGCSKTIIRPHIIENFYPNYMYTNTTKIKTCHGETDIQFHAEIPAFDEFYSDKTLDVLVYNFHDFYDGLIGFEDLSKFNFLLDFENKTLFNQYVNIPLLSRTPDDTSRTYDLNCMK